MGHDTRKPLFGVSDKVRLKPVSLATETSQKVETSPAASLDIALYKHANTEDRFTCAETHIL